MASKTETVTFDGLMTPQVVLTVSGPDPTKRLPHAEPAGQQYTAQITILGVDPVRTTTAEERAAGISQLSNPITVKSRNHRRLIDLAKRACAVAVHTTEGREIESVGQLVLLDWLVARGVRGALRELKTFPVDI